MKFIPTSVQGAFVIETSPNRDSRGEFCRTFCAREFAAHGLPSVFVQCNVSRSLKRGTLRGLHYQKAPSVETKLVRCIAGAIWDVIVDVRPDSPTYMRHFAVELSAQNGRQLFVPAQVAHGFQTLEDQSEVLYLMGDFHDPAAAAGLHHTHSPTSMIQWPCPITSISEKDMALPHSL